jgi:hypothetical protein
MKLAWFRIAGSAEFTFESLTGMAVNVYASTAASTSGAALGRVEVSGTRPAKPVSYCTPAGPEPGFGDFRQSWLPKVQPTLALVLQVRD